MSRSVLHEIMKLPFSERFMYYHGKNGTDVCYLVGPKMDDNFWIIAFDTTDKPDTQVVPFQSLTYGGVA